MPSADEPQNSKKDTGHNHGLTVEDNYHCLKDAKFFREASDPQNIGLILSKKTII